MDREAYLQVYRHSLAHVLAKAVIEIFGWILLRLCFAEKSDPG